VVLSTPLIRWLVYRKIIGTGRLDRMVWSVRLGFPRHVGLSGWLRPIIV
jgi:hypothetical protein